MNNRNSACPICYSDLTEYILTISQVPIHCNILFASRDAAKNTPRGDISLFYCGNCGHIYNAAFQAGRMTYDGEYENSLHFSPRFQAYADSLAVDLVTRYDLKGKDLLEIGSGKGEFLKLLCQIGSNRGIGFDPSYVPEERENNGRVQIFRDYYSQKYAHLPADFIISRHVFEHLAEPTEFLFMLREIIADRSGTIVFFEVPNAAWTIEDMGIWDLIYEHYSYFTRQSLEYVFQKAGFNVLKTAERFNRQFLTVEARPHGNKQKDLTSNNLESLSRFVENFSKRYYEKFSKWRQTIAGMRTNAERAVVWGAGSKGATFLTVINPKDVVTHVVDINPRKQGKFVAGSGLEIIPPESLLKICPDKVILMNGNYESEVKNYLMKTGISAEIQIA